MLAGRSGTSPHTGRIHLLPTAAKEGSVSRQAIAQVLHLTPVGFTYVLQERRRAALASRSTPRCYTPQCSGSLTHYSSGQGGQC